MKKKKPLSNEKERDPLLPRDNMTGKYPGLRLNVRTMTTGQRPTSGCLPKPEVKRAWHDDLQGWQEDLASDSEAIVKAERFEDPSLNIEIDPSRTTTQKTKTKDEKEDEHHTVKKHEQKEESVKITETVISYHYLKQDTDCTGTEATFEKRT